MCCISKLCRPGKNLKCGHVFCSQPHQADESRLAKRGSSEVGQALNLVSQNFPPFLPLYLTASQILSKFGGIAVFKISLERPIHTLGTYLKIVNRYGLSKEQILEAESTLEEMAAKIQKAEPAALLPLVDIMGEAFLHPIILRNM